MALLETKNLRKDFGGLRAVDDVDLRVPQGELRSIIGPNGAGKTTLFNMVAGKISPTEGEIWFKGENITKLPPYLITHKGIARSFQINNLFPNLAVFENVRLAAQAKHVTYDFFTDIMALDYINQKAMEILGLLKLVDYRDVLAANLPYGLQRHLEIGIALASEPELLLLDEPTAGMTQEEIMVLMKLISDISSRLTVILVEHDMKFVMAMSQIITVLHQGRIVAEGKPEEIRSNEEVQRIYLGAQA